MSGICVPLSRRLQGFTVRQTAYPDRPRVAVIPAPSPTAAAVEIGGSEGEEKLVRSCSIHALSGGSLNTRKNNLNWAVVALSACRDSPSNVRSRPPASQSLSSPARDATTNQRAFLGSVKCPESIRSSLSALEVPLPTFKNTCIKQTQIS